VAVQRVTAVVLLLGGTAALAAAVHGLQLRVQELPGKVITVVLVYLQVVKLQAVQAVVQALLVWLAE
jgi:hypothetical protein